MALHHGRREMGLWDNGTFELGTNQYFTGIGSIYSADRYRGFCCLEPTGGVSSDQLIPIDTSKYYMMSIRAKTISRSSPNNYLGYGHTGFMCYDQFQQFIDLRNCGGDGNTTLTRTVNPGDAYIYISSISGWYGAGAEYYFRNVLFFPSTHPYYGAEWKYTRIGFGDYNIYYKEVVDMGGGEYRLKLSSDGSADMVMPDVGYSLPSGTPISNGTAGGSFNYVFVPEFPETWTKYESPVFTGESKNSNYPFRYSTKFITFIHLYNYSRTGETTLARYLFDDILFLQVHPSRTYNLP